MSATLEVPSTPSAELIRENLRVDTDGDVHYHDRHVGAVLPEGRRWRVHVLDADYTGREATKREALEMVASRFARVLRNEAVLPSGLTYRQARYVSNAIEVARSEVKSAQGNLDDAAGQLRRAARELERPLTDPKSSPNRLGVVQNSHADVAAARYQAARERLGSILDLAEQLGVAPEYEDDIDATAYKGL